MPASGTGAVGIDIGGTKLLAIAVDAALDPVRMDTPTTGPELVEQIAAAVQSLTGGAPVSAVGVGVPGLVGPAGEVLAAPNLPALAGVALASELVERLAPDHIWVGNDATAATWAESQRGAGQGVDDLLMITVGTGIGGGLVSGGSIHEGANCMAGEIGHMVVDPDGPDCPCGRRGCWEQLASGNALGRLARDAAQAGRAPAVVTAAGGDPNAVRGEHVSQAAAAGDAEATAIIAAHARWLALGLANLASIFDPEAIVVGGGLIASGEVFLAPLRDAFGGLVEMEDKRRLRIVPAALGSDAGAVGAGLLAAAR